LVVKLRKAGFDPAFEKSGDMTRVVLAGVPDRDLASVKQKLGNAGFGDYLVKQETR
jgi:rare lipoprotein A